MPAKPAAVPTSPGSNTSAASVLTSAEIIWCAKPPTQKSAMASYGEATSPMHAGPIIMNAPSTTPAMRDQMSGTRSRFIRNGDR